MTEIYELFGMAEEFLNKEFSNDTNVNNKSNNEDKKDIKTKKSEKSDSKSKTPKVSEKSKINELEAKLKNFIKIEVKAFGGQIMILEGNEIENINLKTIQSKLVSMGYGEFAEDVIWQVVPNENKTEAILVAGCKFYAKG